MSETTPSASAPGGGTLDPQCGTPMHVMMRGLQQRLQLVFPERRGFSHDFLPSRLTAKEWGALTRRTPWIGLGWAGLRPDQGQGDTFVAASEWFVLLAAKATRPQTRFAGDGLAPGLFSLVHLATVALQGFLITGPTGVGAANAPSGTVQVAGVSMDGLDDLLEEQVAMAAITLSVRYEADDVPGLDNALGNVVGAFEQQGLHWNFSGATLDETIAPGEAA